MGEEEHVRQLEERRHMQPASRCPQFRATRADWVYPVEGYCLQTASPGQLMIPSIAEFNRFCTTGGFLLCPWFCGRKVGDHHAIGLTVRASMPPPEAEVIPP